MSFSHHKQATVKEGKKARCALNFLGTNDSFGILFTNNKAESNRQRKQKIRTARIAREQVRSEVRQYRERRRISSTQFADKLLSFSASADALRFLLMVSPTISSMHAGLGVPKTVKLN